MKSLQSIVLFVTAACLTVLVGCGGSSSSGGNNTQPISVSLGSFPSSLAPKGTQAITATVLNDSKSAGVTWSVACGSSACGSFSASSSMSGASVTYTAPAVVPTGGTVTITATSVTDTTKSASTPAVTITSGITVSVNATLRAIAPSGSTSVTATVTSDAANAGVTWSCVPANACGTLNPTQTASGAASTFTAPASVGNVQVTATSVTDPTKKGSATISVTNAANQTLANGNYVFSASGVDASGSLYSVSGAFTVTGPGVINGGEQDFVDFSNAVSDTNLTGSYAFNSQGNLLITINTGDPLIGPGGQNNTGTGVEVFDVTMVSGTRGLLTEFDTWATSSGTFDMQATSLAAPSGGYAFFTAGLDNSGSPMAFGGVLNVDSANTISGNNSVFDINDAGALVPGAGFAASSVTSPDALGRVVFTLNPSAASTVPGIILAGYMVDSSQIRLVESSDALTGTTGGTALAQTGAGSFTSSSFSGSNYVFGTQGADTVYALEVAGLVTGNSGGSLSGTLNFNDNATQNGQGGSGFTGGTYTVDNTGRVTLSGLSDNATFGYNLQLYLTGDGHALAISMDSNDVLAGFAFQQAAATFNASTFAGNYAMNSNIYTAISTGNYYAGIGPLYADGVGTLSGFVDLNEQNVPVSDLPLSGTFTGNAKGIFTGTIAGIYTPNSSAGVNFTYYVIDPAHAVAIETDVNQETLGYLELQQ